jgi:hypothetical protein
MNEIHLRPVLEYRWANWSIYPNHRVQKDQTSCLMVPEIPFPVVKSAGVYNH